MNHNLLQSISGVLLVVGTCIGAGMLALPAVTGLAGLVPAIVINFLCCLFMMATGLLFLESILWLKDGANVLSLTEHFLGKWGKLLGGLSFAFLYYCLEVSYCAGGAPAFSHAIEQISGIQISGLSSYLLFSSFFGIFVFLGAAKVDRLNWILMIGMILSFVLLILLGSRAINTELFYRSNWKLSIAATPVLFGAYGYHNLLPTLSTYLKRNVKMLRIAIVFGTLIPFIIYSIWQWIIIGTLTLDQIQDTVSSGVPITQSLQKIIGHPWVRLCGEFFGFFALITSFLGVSLSMVDFLGDGLQVQREGWRRFALCLAVFLPPTLFAAANPGIFIEAIGVAGGIGEAILNGLIPIMMVWVGRYVMKLPGEAQLRGGKALLVLLTLITLLIMGIEVHHLLFN